MLEVNLSHRPKKIASFDGLLAVNKPLGMVSKDVSRFLIRRLGKVKIGHVGTLDPAASGVLPILFGKATRLQDYLLDMPKCYEFEMEFGYETDTLDSEGEVVCEGGRIPAEEEIFAAALPFVGEIEQVPPVYSAVKYKGKPLYDYARSGRSVDVPVADLKRRVRIETLTPIDVREKKASFVVRCSRGTYVRTLVKDMANALGTHATLTRLVRTEAAGLVIDGASTLEEIDFHLENERFEDLIRPVESLNIGMPMWRSRDRDPVDRLRAGRPVMMETPAFMLGLASGANEEQSVFAPTQWAKPLILLNENGKAFGMGAAHRDGAHVVINMKRGL